jgi:hypothetical protein
MYNPESYYNNGGNITLTYDKNLYFKPIELIEIGVDKHTKIPIPILNENMVISYDLLTGSTSGSTSYDYFTFQIKGSTTTFNYILNSTSLTTLNINWGDGNIDNISFTGPYIGTHSYLIASLSDYFITFTGDLQYIIWLEAGNDEILSTNILNLKNLIFLSLPYNSLNTLNINGLLYITKLNLESNSLLETDSFYNLLNSNGLYDGDIRTIGGSNAVVTSLSSVARTNLLAKGWTLAY